MNAFKPGDLAEIRYGKWKHLASTEELTLEGRRVRIECVFPFNSLPDWPKVMGCEFYGIAPADGVPFPPSVAKLEMPAAPRWILVPIQPPSEDHIPAYVRAWLEGKPPIKIRRNRKALA